MSGAFGAQGDREARNALAPAAGRHADAIASAGALHAPGVRALSDGRALINPRLMVNVRKAAIDQDLESFLIDFKDAFRRVDRAARGMINQEDFTRLCVGLEIDSGFESYEKIWREATPEGEEHATVKTATPAVYKVLMRNKQGFNVHLAEENLNRKRTLVERMRQNSIDRIRGRFNPVNTTLNYLAMTVCLPCTLCMVLCYKGDGPLHPDVAGDLPN